jgi:hypothetical protein
LPPICFATAKELPVEVKQKIITPMTSLFLAPAFVLTIRRQQRIGQREMMKFVM